jgi:A/G-specific adenine glycosylase
MTDFHLLITDWYRQNKRDLPWRETNDAYKIWLSEIILQQTRVDQGLSYYNKFNTNYPRISDLANASEDQVLRDWQGLGYYSRARNLHATAKIISDQYKGQFPESFEEIRSLKGIGDYTAAAIASFAFNLPHAVVDGNVYRVLSRFFALDTPIDSPLGKRTFSHLAQELLDKNDPATFNQAIMELGALICTPKKPDCEQCPLNDQCEARLKKNWSSLPVKAKKTKVKDRYFHYLIYESAGKTILEQRIQKDIWHKLYQFPLIESNRALSVEELKNRVGDHPVRSSQEIIHVLSHQRIHAQFHHFNFIPSNLEPQYLVIQKNDLDLYALPRLIDRYLEELQL